MTNEERFKQTFGFKPNRECTFANKVVCIDRCRSCKGCPFKNWWKKEYKECFQLREDMDD